MNDLISRSALINKIEAYCIESQDVKFIKDMIKDAPTVEPVRGEWKYDNDLYFSTCRCSECNTLALKRYNFCPNCGADMRGEKND